MDKIEFVVPKSELGVECLIDGMRSTRLSYIVAMDRIIDAEKLGNGTKRQPDFCESIHELANAVSALEGQMEKLYESLNAGPIGDHTEPPTQDA